MTFDLRRVGGIIQFVVASGSIITVSLNPAIDRLIEVEGFTLGIHQVGREVRRVPGGKAVNVTRVLAALDTPNIATGFLGRENRGAFQSVLTNPIVSDEFILIPGLTRENITIADTTGARETHIRETGLAVSREDLQRLREKLERLIGPGAIVVFSGSTPRDIDGTAFAEMVDLCAAGGARVVVDTDGNALRAMAGKKLWLVKCNADELAELIGRTPVDLQDELAAAKVIASTVEIVLLTRGCEGAYLFTSKFGVYGNAPLDEARVKNTVGCGDVLLGAFLAGIVGGRDMLETFADAIAAAAASACDLATAQFDPELARELRTKVELKHL